MKYIDHSAICCREGEKKRDASAPNEIVACTTCGGSSGSPCTHSANNGCATEKFRKQILQISCTRFWVILRKIAVMI
uniref:Uncharacterized protein n=1 Tax=Glossina brevipalpis TaxID=37001 RepID=A0A1A9W511_9MUSC